MRSLHKTVAIILFLTLLVVAMPKDLHAASGIEVETKIGIDGKAQIGKGFPIEVTLTNKGESIKGDLIISSSKGYSSGHNQVIPVELGAGEKKAYQITVSGFGEHIQHSSNPTAKKQHIYFFEGGFEKGKEVKLSGDLDLTPSFLPYDRLVVGLLSDDKDAFNAIKLANYNGTSPELLQMKTVYESSEALEVYDIILINEYNAAEFSATQQKAIIDWVKKGGRLYIGTSSGVEQRLGSIADLLPLVPSGKLEVNEFNLLSSKDPVKLSNFEVTTGDLKETATVVYEQDNIPFVVSDSVGLGEVIQLTYNPASKALIDWEDNGKWWDKLIQNTVNKNRNGHQSIDEMLQQLTYDSELFPSSIISIPVLALLFVVYLVVVVPVLYIILKKKDRREWGWWIIPSLALVTSLGIYLVGAKDRLHGAQVNEMIIFELDQTGAASGFGSSSILTNGGGDYSLSFEGDNLSVSPKVDHYREDFNYSNYPMKESTADGERITFQDVEYWSTRSATLSIPSVELGKLRADLEVVNGKMTGSLTSELAQDLSNVFVISGSKAYELGKLEAGTERKISIDDVENTLMTAPTPYAAQKAFPMARNMHGDGENWKEFSLLEFYLRNGLVSQSSSPLLIAYTNASIINSKINDKVPKRNSLNMIVKPINIKTSETGEFSVTLDDIVPDVTTLEGNGGVYTEPLAHGEGWVDVGDGTFEFVYQLPEQLRKKDVLYQELKIAFDELNEGTEVRLMDEGEGIVLDKQNETLTKKVNDYITNGEIVFHVKRTQSIKGQFFVPRISVKGEFTGD